MPTSYEVSTQHKSWRFSAEQLQLARSNLNAAAVAAIRTAFDKEEVFCVQLTHAFVQAHLSSQDLLSMFLS